MIALCASEKKSTKPPVKIKPWPKSQMLWPIRFGVAILQYVAQKNEVRNDVCNRDLVAYLDYSQATISQHVKKLVNAGLLRTRKQDKFTIYDVDRERCSEYVALLKMIWRPQSYE